MFGSCSGKYKYIFFILKINLGIPKCDFPIYALFYIKNYIQNILQLLYKSHLKLGYPCFNFEPSFKRILKETKKTFFSFLLKYQRSAFPPFSLPCPAISCMHASFFQHAINVCEKRPTSLNETLKIIVH